ncbi:hypothetical protein BOTBODRAFT_27387 [Botryobasidium botryosum FD-172 SS1]|uniref:Uncharacterized protein n=1 Tax=Botryobasidium botryosum (strain FD-172 SS1) TaxID=930990 RepID=A0A067N775_BOTB1|nr:hypothetical protein BOTBODRAFT_27387 [Botryobasidium botryosum FD-172 SS1]
MIIVRLRRKAFPERAPDLGYQLHGTRISGNQMHIHLAPGPPPTPEPPVSSRRAISLPPSFF